jgi:hypothetical protein
MKRKAIILAASNEENPIQGVHFDPVAFASFLQTNLGGAWDEDEIFVQKTPTRSQILAAINSARDTDYSLVFFAGHGETVKMDLPWSEVRMQLGSNENITERELNTGSSRCTLILDCSRRSPAHDEKLSAKSSKLSEHGTRSDFRNLYEKELASAEAGLVKIYSMGVGNVTAGQHSFTQLLLNESNAWAAKNRGTLSLANATTLARDAMTREHLEQQPEYRGGRRLRHFPFAVQI